MSKESELKCIWAYGLRTCVYIIRKYPSRVKKILLTSSLLEKYNDIMPTNKVNVVKKTQLDSEFLEKNHQGIAALVSHESNSLEHVIDKTGENSLVIILDQIQDPANVGAIVRSAVAFNADCIISSTNTSVTDIPSIARASSGYWCELPIVFVNNITRAILKLKDRGYWCYGLDQNATQELHKTDFTKRTALVVGNEQSGMRRLVKETCDIMVRIQVSGKMESLNVSNALAIAMHKVFSTPSAA